jgi:transcriptional/translational regulatory protein YebC/TACO1
MFDEDTILEAGLESGAEDVQTFDDIVIVTSFPADVFTVKESLQRAGIEVSSAEVTKVPSNTVVLEGKEADQAIRLLEQLEENDDVQAVHTNFEMFG